MPTPRLLVNLTPQMLPYDPADRGHKLSFVNQRWKIQNANCDGHYTFVVLSALNPFDDNFVDHIENEVEVWASKTHHHDNLAVGKAVYYAGTIDFNQGVLTKWSNHSGHYQPPAIYRDQAPRDFDTRLFQVVLNDGTLAPLLNDGSPA